MIDELSKPAPPATVEKYTNHNKQVTRIPLPNGRGNFTIGGMMSGCGIGQMHGTDYIPDHTLVEGTKDAQDWEDVITFIRERFSTKKADTSAMGMIVCNVRSNAEIRRKNMEFLGFQKLAEFHNDAHGALDVSRYDNHCLYGLILGEVKSKEEKPK